MRYNKVLPDEISEIIRKIGVDLSEGSEGEGGLILLSRIETALESHGITAKSFGENYPTINRDIKLLIAIFFLYEITLEKAREFGINLEMPRYKRKNGKHIKAMLITEHLENLLNIWKKLIDDARTGLPL